MLRGGRYDTLVGGYGRTARAIGLAVDIEQIAAAQRAADVAPPAPPAALIVAPRERRGDATRLAAALRGAGLRAAVDLGARKTDEQIALYARGAGFTVAVALAPAPDVGEGGASAHVVGDGGAPLAPDLVTRAIALDPNAAAALAAELVHRRI